MPVLPFRLRPRFLPLLHIVTSIAVHIHFTSISNENFCCSIRASDKNGRLTNKEPAPSMDWRTAVCSKPRILFPASSLCRSPLFGIAVSSTAKGRARFRNLETHTTYAQRTVSVNYINRNRSFNDRITPRCATLLLGSRKLIRLGF